MAEVAVEVEAVAVGKRVAVSPPYPSLVLSLSLDFPHRRSRMRSDVVEGTVG